MAKLNVAIIGCGTIAGASHVPNYAKNDGVHIKYLVDILPEKAAALRKQFELDSTSVVEDYHDILNDPELDAVSVCLPNYLHAPVTIDFLKAGKDVLCEKPIALNLDQAKAMKKCADENGRILNIGVVNRFNTAVNHIKDIIDGGGLGELYHIYCSFRSFRSIPGMGGWFTEKAKAGGGVLIDWGVHFVDLIQYVTGNPKILSVDGKAYQQLGKDIRDYTFTSMWAGGPYYGGVCDVDDFVTAMIRTERSTISLNGAWAQNLDENAMFIEFLGDKGGIKLQYGGKFTYYTYKDGMLISTTPEYRTEDMFEVEINNFVDDVKNRTESRATIGNVLITQQVLDLIYASSEENGEIRL